jgi:hypothetical protein
MTNDKFTIYLNWALLCLMDSIDAQFCFVFFFCVFVFCLFVLLLHVWNDTIFKLFLVLFLRLANLMLQKMKLTAFLNFISHSQNIWRHNTLYILFTRCEVFSFSTEWTATMYCDVKCFDCERCWQCSEYWWVYLATNENERHHLTAGKQVTPRKSRPTESPKIG